MSQADGLQKNEPARKPRALPWAGMNQASGLRATDTISSRQYWAHLVCLKARAAEAGAEAEAGAGALPAGAVFLFKVKPSR